MSIPIIFTHYGNSDYLEFTLKQAKETNPTKRLFLLGDSSNQEVARRNGWEHVYLSNLKSVKRDQFNKVFRWIQGSHHSPIKGGKDWLKYVSERFFALETFLTKEEVNSFWHFDSDTMILENLEEFEYKLLQSSAICTTLCNGTCPSGFIHRATVSDYCDSMINDYLDEKFLEEQQNEFDTVNPGFAFTEMRAFTRFIEKNKLSPPPKLSSLLKDEYIWFDDCICQDHDFDTAICGKEGFKSLKNFFYTDDGVFCRTRDLEKTFKFATINCSWVSTKTFKWVLNASMLKKGTKQFLKDELKASYIKQMRHFLKLKARKALRN